MLLEPVIAMTYPVKNVCVESFNGIVCAEAGRKSSCPIRITECQLNRLQLDCAAYRAWAYARYKLSDMAAGHCTHRWL